MSLLGAVQSRLSTLQAIPLVGPFVFSPVKVVVSKVQIVAGAVLGTVYGTAAVGTCAVNSQVASDLAQMSIDKYGEVVDGFGSALYAIANVATVGILGICVELSRSRTVVVIHHHQHSIV